MKCVLAHHFIQIIDSHHLTLNSKQKGRMGKSSKYHAFLRGLPVLLNRSQLDTLSWNRLATVWDVLRCLVEASSALQFALAERLPGPSG